MGALGRLRALLRRNLRPMPPARITINLEDQYHAIHQR